MMNTIHMKKQAAPPARWARIREMIRPSEGSKILGLDRFATWRRALPLMGLLVVFLVSIAYSWRLDPLAAPLDAGILSVLLFAVLAVAAAKHLSAWLTLRTFKPHFNKLTPWQKVLFFGALYLSYFWGLVLVLIAVL